MTVGDRDAGDRSSATWASTQSATASRAATQAASAVSALIRAASASRARRSSDGAIAAAASRSRIAVTPASRTTVLIRLISLSHSRAAASTSVRRPGAAARVAEVGLGDLLLEPDVARVGGGRGLLGPRDVGVVGPLGGAERVVGHAHGGPGVDGDLAALVRDLAGLAARSVHGHRDERVRAARSRRRRRPGRRSGSVVGRVHERDGGRDPERGRLGSSAVRVGATRRRSAASPGRPDPARHRRGSRPSPAGAPSAAAPAPAGVSRYDGARRGRIAGRGRTNSRSTRRRRRRARRPGP